jgi:hypothetical protein
MTLNTQSEEPIPPFFHQAFHKSLGSLFRELYSESEIQALEREIFLGYTSLRGQSCSAVFYTPGPEDPLLRLRHTILLIGLDSLPFFTSRLRKTFYLLDLEISRSLHFHPEPGKELFYIEILGGDLNRSFLESLVPGIQNSYERTQKSVIDFEDFTQNKSAPWFVWGSEEEDLLDWLLSKS